MPPIDGDDDDIDLLNGGADPFADGEGDSDDGEGEGEGQGPEGRDGDEGSAGEGDDEGPDADAGAVDAGQQRPAGRAGGRIARLAREKREAEERAADLRRRLDALEHERRPAAEPQQETPEQEAQRLALMTPEEKMEYRMEKMQRELRAASQRAEFVTMDTADKAAFDARAAADPRRAKYAPLVEQRLQEMRRNGANAPREAVLYYMIGERVMNADPKKINAQRNRGRQNVERQRAPAGSGRGDVRAERRPTGKTAAQRLENVEI